MSAKSPPETDTLDTLKGSVSRVTFHNEESGFCVLRVNAKGHRDVLSMVATLPTVAAGEQFSARGTWVVDKRHGMQFHAAEFMRMQPTSAEGIEKYLASGMVKGVGPHFAKQLVKAFGDQVFSVIENTPKKLLSLPGIGKKRQEQVVAAWGEQKIVRDIMVFLQSHGVGTARAVRIYKTYGDHAIELVQANPYRLASEVYGIGFKTADELASRLGIAPDSDIRARAGLKYVCHTLTQKGHCAVPRETLLKEAHALLLIDDAILASALGHQIESKRLIEAMIGDVMCIYPVALYEAEQEVAERLMMLSEGSCPWGVLSQEAVLSALVVLEKKSKLCLSPSQTQAVIDALQSKVMIITGGPGVGKTTIVKTILGVIGQSGASIALAAPTGRAAKRLSESTGRSAKTIHRLLGYEPGTHGFHHDEHNPLVADYVVIDEASMLDIVLMQHVLKAIAVNTALLFVGDVDQLPSVGPGSVLADIINAKQFPVARLTEVHRQAAHSQIITNAHRINSGELPHLPSQSSLSDFYLIEASSAEDIHDKLLKVIDRRIPERFGFDAKADIQVLTPMRRGGLGTQALNVALQQLLNGHAEPKITRYGNVFSPGDKVMQTQNNYDKNVFNGDIGVIRQIDLKASTVSVFFETRVIEYDFTALDELSLAYAISIHKSQGSEYPVVVIPLASQHYMMLARNLLYTAVTRGKSLVVLIAEKKALSMAVSQLGTDKRLTNLSSACCCDRLAG